MITHKNITRFVMLTHWDLDAAGSVIAAKQFYDIKDFKAQGYGKVDKNINLLVEKYGNSDYGIVIGDLCLLEDQFKVLLDNFPVVHFYDHHIDSELLTKYDNGDNIRVWFTIKMCATSLIIQINRKLGVTKPIMEMSKVINAYDMWLTHNKSYFTKGKAYNTLFWDKSLFGFVPRFIDGFSSLEQNEMSLIKDKIQTLKENIKSTLEDQSEKQDNFLLSLLDEDQGDVINEMTLVNGLEFDTFCFIIDRQGVLSGSVRTTRDDINVNEMLNTLLTQVDNVSVAGGHDKAGGITFKPNTTIDSAIKTCYLLDKLFDK